MCKHNRHKRQRYSYSARSLEDGVVGASEGTLDGLTRVVEDVEQLCHSGPHTSTVHEERLDNDERVDNGERDLLPVLEELVPVEVEPQDGADTEGGPRDHGGRRDGEDGVEDGNGSGHDEDDDPEDGRACEPCAPGLEGVLGDFLHGVHATEDKDEHPLDGGVSEHHSGGEQSEQHDTVGNLGREGWSRAKGGRGGVLASQAVDGNGDDDVQRDGNRLQPDERRHKVLGRVLHLSNDTRESDVAGIGVADAQASAQALPEGRVSDNLDLLCERAWRVGRIGDAEADHDDENSGKNGNRSWYTDPCDKLERTWQTEQPASNSSDGHERNSAGSVVAHGVETNGHGDGGGGAGEHDTDEQNKGTDGFERAATNDTTHVDEVEAVRMPLLELQHLVCRVR